MRARGYQIIGRAMGLLLRYRLRSALLMLSSGLGVAGVICPVNYAASGTQQILDQIRRMGTNVIIITPTQSRAVGGRARTGQSVTTLAASDHASIRREILMRARSSAFVTSSFWMKAGNLSKNAPVIGCESDYFAIKNWPMMTGDIFDTDQERAAARVVVLGHTVARDLFGSASPVGERVMINRVPFTVIGVLDERGQGLDVSNEDNQVYVPLTTAMRRLINADYLSGILVEIDSLGDMDTAAEQIHSLLLQLHRLQPGQKDDFLIQNQKSLLDTQMAAADRLNFFLRWIGTSALLVSGLGMLGITWIAVNERTREIGTRRALGATAADIFLQVLSESAALAFAGCVLGLAFSWPLSRAISNFAGLGFVFVGRSALFAFVSAAVLNLAFALWPARRAALLNPTEALRYE